MILLLLTYEESIIIKETFTGYIFYISGVFASHAPKNRGTRTC